MKKFLLPLLMTIVVLFTACRDEGARMHTYYYTVKPNQWEANITTYNDGTYTTNYYYSVWENVDITPAVIDHGVVLVYYCSDFDEMLPYTMYFTDDNGVPYQERIEFDIEAGKIYFIIKDTDFNTALSMQNIKEMQFKVTTICE